MIPHFLSLVEVQEMTCWWWFQGAEGFKVQRTPTTSCIGACRNKTSTPKMGTYWRIKWRGQLETKYQRKRDFGCWDFCGDCADVDVPSFLYLNRHQGRQQCRLKGLYYTVVRVNTQFIIGSLPFFFETSLNFLSPEVHTVSNYAFLFTDNIQPINIYTLPDKCSSVRFDIGSFFFEYP